MRLNFVYPGSEIIAIVAVVGWYGLPLVGRDLAVYKLAGGCLKWCYVLPVTHRRRLMLVVCCWVYSSLSWPDIVAGSPIWVYR